MTPNRKLDQYIERLHWIKRGDDGVPELYLDNHMLQTFRMCEARFWNDFVEGYVGNGRIWFLDLGTCVHKMIELYYMKRATFGFNINDWALNTGSRIWNAKNMDFYETHPIWSTNFKKLNGRIGFTLLMLQYAMHFNQENERLRVIGTELYFGKGKEVPLYEGNIGRYILQPPLSMTEIRFNEQYKYPFRLYLSGKIDLLIDDGHSIGPMDHKTSADFRGKNPLIGYEIHDGMTGYVYAAKQLAKFFPELERREANKIWMNFLQIKEEKNMLDRFKRIPLFKTEFQLEEYRLRMIRTASKIYDLLTSEAIPDFNTSICTNWMHGTCPLHVVHRQGSAEAQQKMLDTHFVKKDIWDPQKIDAEEEAVLQILKDEVNHAS